MAEAQGAGADAFFDEKYGERVRTIRVEGFSHELCGGTHCHASGQVGGFMITGERSIGSGMRRIEAVTGAGADRLVEERLALLDRAVATVGARGPEALEERIGTLLEELRDSRRRIRAGAAAGGRPTAAGLAGGAEVLAPGASFVGAVLDLESIDVLKGLAKDVRAFLPSGVIALGLDAEEPQLFVTVSPDLVARGLSAGALVQAVVGGIDGRGGGRPEMAQGKGTHREGLRDAIAAVRSAVSDRAAAS
jgi:alanyl-tRNA synthetase